MRALQLVMFAIDFPPHFLGEMAESKDGCLLHCVQLVMLLDQAEKSRICRRRSKSHLLKLVHGVMQLGAGSFA